MMNAKHLIVENSNIYIKYLKTITGCKLQLDHCGQLSENIY